MNAEPLPIGDFTANCDANPMVIRHGRGPEGRRCRDCRRILPTSHRTARRYWKCERRGITRGAGTDHRLKWNACRLFEEAQP